MIIDLKPYYNKYQKEKAAKNFIIFHIFLNKLYQCYIAMYFVINYHYIFLTTFIMRQLSKIFVIRNHYD